MTNPYRDENEALRVALEAERAKVRELEGKLKPKTKKKTRRLNLRGIFLKSLFDHSYRPMIYTLSVLFIVLMLVPLYSYCVTTSVTNSCGTACRISENTSWYEDFKRIGGNRVVCECSSLGGPLDDFKKIIRDPTR